MPAQEEKIGTAVQDFAVGVSGWRKEAEREEESDCHCCRFLAIESERLAAIHPKQQPTVGEAEHNHERVNESSEQSPQKGAQEFALDHVNNDEQHSRRGEGPAGKVLVHDVEGSPGDRNRQQRRKQGDAAPLCYRSSENEAPDMPGTQKHEKYRKQMPQKNCPTQGQMSHSDRRGNQVWKESQTRMRGKERSVLGIELRVERFVDAGQVDFGILDPGVIPVDDNGEDRSQEKQRQFFTAGIFFQVLNL